MPFLAIRRFCPCFPPSHLQSYNYNCTIHLLQLQMTFYNCRNCDQLKVKICPGLHIKAECCSRYLSNSLSSNRRCNSIRTIIPKYNTVNSELQYVNIEL